MWHYVAKLGRNPIAKYSVQAVGVVALSGYVGAHTVGQTLVCDLFAAKSPEGTKRQEFSGELMELIKTVYLGLKKTDFAKPQTQVGESLFNNMKSDLKIKWFVSSTVEPVNIGMSEWKTGIMIGVPNHYNYVKPSDVPDSLLEIHDLKLFKSFFQKNQANEEPVTNSNHGKNVVYMRKDLPSGEEYLDSFLLSDNAKKFSIARELYYADTYKPLMTSIYIGVGILAIVGLSRFAVQKFKLKDRHVSQRAPFYLVSAFAGHYIFTNMNDLMRNFYTIKADLRAINIGEDYRQGAIEYFNKIIKRHKALREQIKSKQAIFDEEGNLRQPLLRVKYTPYTERLKLVSEEPSEELLKKYFIKKQPHPETSS